MNAMEQCRPCAEGAFKVSPHEDVPLCQGHWNAYLDMLATGGAPCNAHLIGSKA